ncbi:hypothetical protein HanPSC8_Chr10g0448631 [Helianthus annuus]|nr:hypothetical protein HanPSC8_Chr10g0448631 [Helianthus annuus]
MELMYAIVLMWHVVVDVQHLYHETTIVPCKSHKKQIYSYGLEKTYDYKSNNRQTHHFESNNIQTITCKVHLKCRKIIKDRGGKE